MRDDSDAPKALPLPTGVRSRFVDTGTGLRQHYLEAGFHHVGRPTILLLHGFPELAFSWRKIMPTLAAAGYRVVAPDQRGYGRTTGWSEGYDVDLAEFGMPQLVRDAVALLGALRIDSVEAVIGHDFGSPVAAWCGIIRPDVFPSVACMSAPFGGPPAWEAGPAPDVHAELAALTPPRRHYQWYYGDRDANDHMMWAKEGLAAFIRAYFHCKSGDWPGNRPYTLGEWCADDLAKLPRYYVMDANANMAETAASMAPTAGEAAGCRWFSEAELQIYTSEYGRTGFQGGLNWYRRATSDEGKAELRLYAGRKLEPPSCFIGGARDWGVYQIPGALEAMERTATSNYLGTVLVEGAGHWVQQEDPSAVAATLLAFLETARDVRDGPQKRRRETVRPIGAGFGVRRENKG